MQKGYDQIDQLSSDGGHARVSWLENESGQIRHEDGGQETVTSALVMLCAFREMPVQATGPFAQSNRDFKAIRHLSG